MNARFAVAGLLLCTAACATSTDGTERSSSRASAGEVEQEALSKSTTPRTACTCVSVVDIRNTLGGRLVIPRDLNARGQVVGSAAVAGESVHAFSWDGGSMIDLGTLGGAESHALAVNDRGEVVGYAAPEAETVSTRATLWRDGTIVDLGTLGGGFSIAGAINGAGQIVGNSLTAEADTHAFLWESGVMKDLGTLGGTFSSATHINDRGQIVGRSRVPGDPTAHVFLWESGVMKDLGPESGELDARGEVLIADYPNAYLWRDDVRTPIVPFGDAIATSVTALSDRGQVVGGARRADGRDFAFLWDDGATTLVGPEDRPGYVTALAVNRRAQVVGFVGDGAAPRAFSWKDGELTFLADENERTIALAINDRGQIMGTSGGVDAKLWETHRCKDERRRR